MKENQLRILQVMNDATSSMDLNTFAQTVNLKPHDAIEQVHLLAKEGFLKKIGSGYCLTEKGKNSIKITHNVPEAKSFQFYIDVDKPLGFTVYSLTEFYLTIKQICSDSLEFHFYRGDFEKWIRDVLLDLELAQEISTLKPIDLHGETLRKTLLSRIDDKYGIGNLF